MSTGVGSVYGSGQLTVGGPGCLEFLRPFLKFSAPRERTTTAAKRLTKAAARKLISALADSRASRYQAPQPSSYFEKTAADRRGREAVRKAPG
ncbi:hypothetical protein ACIPWI_35165 [Streptomyces sp. NPDC090046]|uniref:hypothetical protein n=1 Tax=Streptomyces sp. NPDC090046 TaxID=3365928 RepID=UPI003800023A